MMIDRKNKILRVGTRTSPLAMRQTEMVRDALRLKHPDIEIEIVPIKSSADWKKQDGEKSLSEQAGGKGQFAKEIEQAQLDGKIDCGVHSAKDMPSFLPDQLQIMHFLPRYDAREVFISHQANKLEDLPKASVIGTCSPRRQSQLLAKRPDLKVVPFRGNVQTRIDKVVNKQVDATFLAMAGVGRLGIKSDLLHPVDINDMLPAAGQGAICIETKIDDTETQNILDAINCRETLYRVTAEREVLKVLDGSCHTPIAAYAEIEDGEIYLRAFVGSLDGSQVFEDVVTRACPLVEDARMLGFELGNKLKTRVLDNILVG